MYNTNTLSEPEGEENMKLWRFTLFLLLISVASPALG
jgi:hypothetical protein